MESPLLLCIQRIVGRINELHTPRPSKIHLDCNLCIFRPRIMRVLSRKHEPASKREFERAIELNPNYVAAHYFFGLTTLPALGEFDRAIAELRHAVDLDPFSLLINSNLGFVLTVARRYPEAIVQLQKTLELGPNYGLAHRQLGEALELSGHMDKAIVEYEKAYKFTNDTHALAY